MRSFNKLPKQPFLDEIEDEVMDNFYHFFQDCYHLKDWIKNDCGLNQEIRDRVEDFITKSKYLKIVADIANATKHLKLTKTYR